MDADLKQDYLNYLRRPLREIIESVSVELTSDLPWTEIRDIAQKLYTEIANHDHLTLSLEKTYLLIFQVCKQEPEALLHFLEREALNFLVELKTQLNVILTDPHLRSGGDKLTSRTLVQSIWTLWENISTSIKIFNGLLIYLHNFIRERHVNFNFGQVNQVLFLELLLQDPLIAKYIRLSRAMMHSTRRSSSGVPDKFFAFEATLRAVSLKAPFMKNQIAMYHYMLWRRIPVEHIGAVVSQLRDVHLDDLHQRPESSSAFDLDDELEDASFEGEDYIDDEDEDIDDEEADDRLDSFDMDVDPALPDDIDLDSEENEEDDVSYLQEEVDFSDSESEENSGEAADERATVSINVQRHGENMVERENAHPAENDLIDDTDEEDYEDMSSVSSWQGVPLIDPRSVDELVQFIESGSKQSQESQPGNKGKRKKKNKQKRKKISTEILPGGIDAASSASTQRRSSPAPVATPASVNSGISSFPKFWDEESLEDPAIQQRVEAEVELFTQRLAQVQISHRSTAQLPRAQFEQIAKFSRENPKNIFRYLYQDKAADASNQIDRQR